MSTYDDYLTHDDKPYAENINDALLLSNVFDLTVPIELPTMFRTGVFNTSESSRKAGVALVTYVSSGSGVTVDSDTISGTGDLSFKFYPNFNSYGSLTNLSWTVSSGSVTADIIAANNDTLVSGHTGGVINGPGTGINTLQEFKIILHLTDVTGLSKLNFVMANKEETRYGAECGISDVTGLETRLSSIEGSEDTIRNIKLTSSNYNPTINSSITVTATVTDINNNPVKDEEVTPQLNGTDLTTKETDTNGQASWSITCNNWGLQDITLNNTSIQFNVKGWKQIASDNSTYRMRCDGNMVEFQFIGGTTNISGDWTTILTISDALSDYRPENNLYAYGPNNTLYRFGASGDIQIVRVTGSATSTTKAGTVYWRLK